VILTGIEKKKVLVYIQGQLECIDKILIGLERVSALVIFRKLPFVTENLVSCHLVFVLALSEGYIINQAIHLVSMANYNLYRLN
jgi:hypothetical protein